ncbi:MAG: hypothetical protein E4H44_03155 [Candidatus Aminicenantes bacterium]|nr:MAG: hypothetical protein E4H44_03155 [Candidatus Aminicenantes bacterium]
MTTRRAGTITGCLHLLLFGGLEAQTAATGASAFVLVERAEMRQPNAGTMYRYWGADSAEVLLFVTPLPPSLDPCIEDCAERAVEVLSNQFAQAVVSDRRRHSSDSVRVAGSTVVAPPPGSWLEQGRLTALRTVRDSQAVDSYLWLFLGRETLVQVRGADPAGGIDFATLERLVSTLVLGVPPPSDCPYGISTDLALVTVFPIDVPLLKLPSMVDSTLAAQGYRFAFRSEGAGLWRTAPRFYWQDGSALARASEGIRPGIELVATTAVGEGRSLVAISSRPVCRVPNTDRRSDERVTNLARKAMEYALDAILDTMGYLR